MIKSKIVINGVMTTVSGLSILGTNDELGKSAQDNPIIRNPFTYEPYVPGSSIKGKMRSLMELSGMASGNINGDPCGCGKKDCKVCKLFGAHRNTKPEVGQPRVIFRDATLAKEFQHNFDVIEVKSETAIDRKTGTAKSGSLRSRERIAAGVNLNYEIVILVYDGDDAKELQSLVELGLHMIEATGLGGKVTAGYGKVNFHVGEDSYHVEVSKF